MKKIIVREKILPPGYINSAFIELCKGKEYDTLRDFLMDYNYDDIMKKLYAEEISNISLEDTKLYSLYKLAIESGEDNEYF